MGISIGLVGLGQFGREFADLFRQHPAVERVGLCDREPARVAAFADRPDWKDKFRPSDAYASLDAMCAGDLDAVVIITQPWLHAPQAIQAMQAGKHVYSAVPLICIPDPDETLEWCDRLVETARTTGVHYMLGETTYYRPETMFCRRMAAAGAFGDFVHAQGDYLHPYDGACDLREVYQARHASASGREWVARLAEYRRRGVLTGPMHYPTHSVSGPMSVMNAHPVKVCCWGWANRTGEPFFADSAFSDETALFQMSNGSTMRIREYREIGHTDREGFDVFGTQASFELGRWYEKRSSRDVTVQEMRDPLPPEVADAWRDPATGEVPLGGHGGSHAYLVHEFVDAIATGRRPAIHAWTAARYMAAGATAHKSALRDGEVLNVPDWGDPA